jgi:uncharacterized membrane protein YczE
MNSRAWFYVGLVYILGSVLLGFSIFIFKPDPVQLPAFIVFMVLATLTQLFKSEAPSHQAYHPALIFVFAGVLLLDPFLFATLIPFTSLVYSTLQYWDAYHFRFHRAYGFCAH